MDKAPDPTKTPRGRTKTTIDPALQIIWCLALPTLALIIPGFIQTRERVALRDAGVKTQARITEVIQIGGRAGNAKVGVVYSYHPEAGTEISGTQILPSFVASPLKRDETVDVYYQREDPTVVLMDAAFVYEADRLHTFGFTIIVLTVLLIAGTVFLRKRATTVAGQRVEGRS